MIKNKNQPAFPVENDMSDKMYPNENFYGLSKREYFAGLAMQGLVACGDLKFASTAENFAQYAVTIADALLTELSKPQP